jgi:antitoxin HigA-1
MFTIPEWPHVVRKLKQMRDIAPVHPGRILAEEFLADLGMSQRKLAGLIDVPQRRVNQIIHGERAITPDMSLRLGKLFGQSDSFWLNLRRRYDSDVALYAGYASLAAELAADPEYDRSRRRSRTQTAAVLQRVLREEAGVLKRLKDA